MHQWPICRAGAAQEMQDRDFPEMPFFGNTSWLGGLSNERQHD